MLLFITLFVLKNLLSYFLFLITIKICSLLPPDHRLLHPVGHPVPAAQPGPYRRPPARPRRVPRRSAQPLRRRALPGRKQTQELYAAGRSHPARLHVHHPDPVRAELPPDPAGHPGVHLDGARYGRLQDEAVGADFGRAADGAEPVPQRLVDHSGVQAAA